MSKVSIIIPVYGQWDLVKRNIDSLLKFDKEYIKEILVVNDCSPVINPYFFDQSYVKVIDNERNSGYAETVNNGLIKTNTDIIVLLDSDAYPIGPFIQKLIEMYNNNPLIGCIGFSTIDGEGNNTGNFQHEPSVFGLILGQQLQSKFGFLRFWRNKSLLPNSCAVSFRKSFIEEVGYFDGTLFPVLDADVDISMRIIRSSWKLIFTKEIIICHKGGNSYKVNYKRFLLHHSSRWKLLKKYNQIMFPNLTKNLLKSRIRIEILIFLALLKVKVVRKDYNEKMNGRQILLKEVDQYE